MESFVWFAIYAVVFFAVFRVTGFALNKYGHWLLGKSHLEKCVTCQNARDKKSSKDD